MLTDANALRTDGLITVILIGQLPTPCDEVAEIGHYAGTTMPLTDPCASKIFIRERRKPGLENVYCTLGLGNIWTINRVIPDSYSNTVEIFINDLLVRKIPVAELTGTGMFFTNRIT